MPGDGLASFYNSGMFADYPPGYMYILWLTGSIARALGLEYGGAGYVLITKLPGILADISRRVYDLSAWRANRLTGSQSSAFVLHSGVQPGYGVHIGRLGAGGHDTCHNAAGRDISL